MSFNLFSARFPRSPRRRRLLGAAGGALAVAALAGRALANQPLPVVATFSILADMVGEVGGERVAVTTIVGRNSDVHNFEAAPQHARALLEARVLVLNGLDFEPWLPRLLQASGFEGRQVLASDGVEVRRLGGEPGHGHAHGDVDPHAWQDLSNGARYVRNIARGLAQADPRNTRYYEGRAERYIGRIEALDAEIRATLADIPAERRRVISSHDAFGYFGAAYGVEFIPVAGLSNQAEPSARDVARIITLARDHGVSGVFIENMSNPAMARQIARESGALMGGTLYADALGPLDEPAATYLGMLSWNAGRLAYVLRKAAGTGPRP